MRQLHYLITCVELTGDSTVKFYASADELKKAFDDVTKPLMQYCLDNNLVEDEAYSIVLSEKSKPMHGLRFDIGYDEGLDALIGYDCNVYYEMLSLSVPDEHVHYIAEFSQWVSDSVISFYTPLQARSRYEQIMAECLETCRDHGGHLLLRHDTSTWGNGDTMTIFEENEEKTKFYSGWSDPTYTTVLGYYTLSKQDDEDTVFFGWHIDDVIDQANEDGIIINSDEAKAILKAVEASYNHSQGINLDTITIYIGKHVANREKEWSTLSVDDMTTEDIKDLLSVYKFAWCLVNNEDLNFHPDTDFVDYVKIGTNGQEPSYTDKQSEHREALMEQCLVVCKEAERDIYEVCFPIMAERTGIRLTDED